MKTTKQALMFMVVILWCACLLMAGCGGGGGGDVANGGSTPPDGPGPGDQANYFPFSVGNMWRYQGVESTNGQGQVEYFSSAKVIGTKTVNGTATTVLSVTNLLNDGSTYDNFYSKTDRGVYNYGDNDATDAITPQVVPYPEMLFPVQTGTNFVAFSKAGIDSGIDIDGDGITDKISLSATVRVAGFETVSLSIGIFPSAARVERTLNLTYTLSTDGTLVPATQTDTIYLASGVGIVKQATTLSIPDINLTSSYIETLTGYLVDGQGKGVASVETLTTGLAAADSNTETPGRPAMAFDGTNYLVISRRVGGTPDTMTGYIVSPTGMTVTGFDLAVPGSNRVAVAYGANNYLVVSAPSTAQISAYRVTPAGVVLDGPAGIAVSSVNPNSYNYFPVVSSDGTNFLIVWSQFNLNTNLNQIQAALISPAGQILNEFRLVAGPGEQSLPTVSFDGTNYLVAWQDTRNSSDGDIYGTRVKSDGTVLDPTGIPITTAPGVQHTPQITYSAGQYMAVWVDGGYLQPMTVHGARISTNGTLIDGPAASGGIVINTTDINGGYPAVAPFGNGFLTVWDVRGYDPARGVYGARINASGQLVNLGTGTHIFPISGSPTEFASRYLYPAVATGVNNSLVAWINNREVSGTTKDLQAALLYPF